VFRVQNLVGWMGVIFCLSRASDSGVDHVCRGIPRKQVALLACFIGHFSFNIAVFAVFFRNQRRGEKLPLRVQAALVSIHTRF